jgi:uncharacterized protein
MSAYRKTTWLNPKVEVRGSPIQGQGLFAKERMDEGEPVVIMGGRVLTIQQFQSLKLEKYSAAAIGENLHMLLDTPNPAENGNHSCDANTWMLDEVTTTARRSIEVAEEITIDYATQTDDPAWSVACKCGSDVCRGVVRGDDWKLPDVQARYAGHFSPFLNRRIAAHRSAGRP